MAAALACTISPRVDGTGGGSTRTRWTREPDASPWLLALWTRHQQFGGCFHFVRGYVVDGVVHVSVCDFDDPTEDDLLDVRSPLPHYLDWQQLSLPPSVRATKWLEVAADARPVSAQEISVQQNAAKQLHGFLLSDLGEGTEQMDSRWFLSGHARLQFKDSPPFGEELGYSQTAVVNPAGAHGLTVYGLGLDAFGCAANIQSNYCEDYLPGPTGGLASARPATPALSTQCHSRRSLMLRVQTHGVCPYGFFGCNTEHLAFSDTEYMFFHCKD